MVKSVQQVSRYIDKLLCRVSIDINQSEPGIKEIDLSALPGIKRDKVSVKSLGRYPGILALVNIREYHH